MNTCYFNSQLYYWNNILCFINFEYHKFTTKFFSKISGYALDYWTPIKVPLLHPLHWKAVRDTQG